MGKILVIIASIIAVAGLASCSSATCEGNQNSLPLAGFYSMSTGRQITLDSLEIGGVGAPHDSLLYNVADRVTEVYLPFRSREESTSFFIRYRRAALDIPALVDTLTFAYRSTPYFAGEECGAMLRYRVVRLDYTRHLIDSIGLVDSLITNAAVQQIHIFMRAAEDDETTAGEGARP